MDKSLKLPISTGIIGAISELTACVHYMGLGYDVFRAVSQSSKCDLIITKNGASHRIEVRTGHKCANLSHVTTSIKRIDQTRFDVLCIVVKGTITEVEHNEVNWKKPGSAKAVFGNTVIK
jgi:hypothetical protein